VKRQEREEGPKADCRTAKGRTNQTELNQNGSAQNGSTKEDCSDQKDCCNEAEKPTPVVYKAWH